MRHFSSILILTACLWLWAAPPAAAGFLGDDTLLSINENSYSSDDFSHWWKFWKEDGTSLPETPEPYINWLLLSSEAEKMELDKTPSFKRQTRIFMQSRTLLMLKHDAVDSRIEVPEAEVWSVYEKDHLPRWLVQRFEFENESIAMATWEELNSGILTVEELRERDPQSNGPLKTYEAWLRAGQIDPEWKNVFLKYEVGQVLAPDDHKRGDTLYFLKDQKGADEEDFARLSGDIRKNLWKIREKELTRALLAELRQKYQVEINEERLVALDINGAPDTFTDEAIITTSKKNISEKEFMKIFSRVLETRPTLAAATLDPEQLKKLKQDTAENIIGQAVTNWESVDRHYEEKEPFKWEYEFNYRHRLTLALERQMFAQEAKVTEDEIKQHYEENLDRYKQPTMVKLYIIDETQAPIDQVWADVAVGKNIHLVVDENFENAPPLHETPVNHLDPEVREVVNNMVPGETSRIFQAQGIRVMVHLMERTPEKPLPLARVQESIRAYLADKKLIELRNQYLDTLKSGSEIKVRERRWKKIQKELGGA